MAAIVSDAVARLLQRSAGDRFSTGAEVAAALRSQPTAPGSDVASATDRGRRDTSIAVLPFVNLSADPENEYFKSRQTLERDWLAERLELLLKIFLNMPHMPIMQPFLLRSESHFFPPSAPRSLSASDPSDAPAPVSERAA